MMFRSRRGCCKARPTELPGSSTAWASAGPAIPLGTIRTAANRNELQRGTRPGTATPISGSVTPRLAAGFGESTGWGNAPDHPSDVVGDQQRAGGVHRDPHRAPAGVSGAVDKTGKDELRRTAGLAGGERHED